MHAVSLLGHAAAVLLPAGSGFELTEHFATTLDGYILRIFRLQHPSSHAAALAPGNSSPPARLTPRPVALMQHALLDSSAGWLLQGPGNSLACSLALEGGCTSCLTWPVSRPV
ncbi:hypothetical protein [Bosea sp. (in: a-proteobacteria)]|uniref:hypothetical protein n=1 Tax=Bosea sp. (in: a-proteobacteria) TaxID=1871050 RepID=UPI004033D057